MTNDIIAREGHAIIHMKPAYGDFEGDMYIPKGAKSRTTIGRMGQVLSVTMFKPGVNSLVFVNGKLKARPQYIHNDCYRGMLEKFVLCRHATLIFGELYDCRLEHIQSIVPEEAIPTEDELGRCRSCKSDGEGNILLDHAGFCPNCGFNRHGLHQAMVEMDITEADIDHLVRNPAEVDHFMNTGGKAVDGTIISYPGQKNRSGNVMADLHELNKFMKGRKK